MKKFLLTAVASIFFLGSCSGADTSSAGSDLNPLPEGPWTELAHRLTGAKDLETATAVTRDVLARGGIATFDGERMLVEAIGPAAPFVATPRETVNLAMEARDRRHRGQLNVAELAQMLSGFGWPFPEHMQKHYADEDSLVEVDDPRSIRRQEKEAQKAAEQRAQAARAAADAADDRIQAERIEALQARAEEAHKASGAARLAYSKAPRDGRPAAQARVEEASAARTAAYQELRAAQREASDAKRERTRQANRDRERAFHEAQVGRQVGPNYAAGEHLMKMFEIWVREAAENPKDPRSFTPLFLAEMARLQDPPFDILGSVYVSPGRGGQGTPVDLRGSPRSGELRFSLLELELFVAAFQRGLPSPSASPSPTGSARLEDAISGLADLLVPSAHAASGGTPCSDFKDRLGGFAGETGGLAASEGAGKALEKAAEATFGEGAGDSFGNALTSIGIVGKIVKLAAFYAHNQVTVTATPEAMHKYPHGDRQRVEFTARAGVSPEELEEYKRAIEKDGKLIDESTRDCLGFAGMPTWTDIADVAKDADRWRVQWRLVRGSPLHAVIYPKFNEFTSPGLFSMNLKRTSPASAEATLVAVVPPEKASEGEVARTYVTARATVDASEAPSLGTFVNAAKGPFGVADAVTELAAGWIQSVFKPKAYATIEVEFHCKEVAKVYYTPNPVADGRPQPPDGCVVPGEKKAS